MSKHLTRHDRKRRKKKAACRERRYLSSIEEKMVRGNVDFRAAADALGKEMADMFREEMARPTLTSRIIQRQQAATKGVP